MDHLWDLKRGARSLDLLLVCLNRMNVIWCFPQALDDLIMVSFSGPGNKVFQGVLLEASKRYIVETQFNEDNM